MGLGDLFGGDSYSLEQQFPYAFRATLKLVLRREGGERADALLEFVQGLDTDGRRYLEHAYCQEMALVNLHKRDLSAAKYFAHMAVKKYLMVSLFFTQKINDVIYDDFFDFFFFLISINQID